MGNAGNWISHGNGQGPQISKGDVITILDLRGRTLAKQIVNSPTQSATVQLNGVSKGVYIGKVENNIGQYNTKFILK